MTAQVLVIALRLKPDMARFIGRISEMTSQQSLKAPNKLGNYA